MSKSFNNFVYGAILSFLFASVMSSTFNFTFDNTANIANSTNSTNSTFNSTGLLECDFCQFVARETESLLLTNETLTKIQTDLDSLCQKTKHDVICESIVNTYLSQIIKFLEQEESPEKVCQQIGVC